MLKRIILLCILIIGGLLAQPAAYRDLYLERNALSARSLAMGMTGAAVPQDNYDAVFINPAAISTRPNVLFKSESTLTDVHRFTLQGTVSLEKTTDAVSVSVTEAMPSVSYEAIFGPASEITVTEAALVTSNTTLTASSRITADRSSLINTNSSPQRRLSLAYSDISVSDIPIAELSGTELQVADTAGYSEQEFLLGYAQNIVVGIQAGITMKYFKDSLNINQAIYDQGNASGSDIDLGLLWQNPNLDIGVGYKNVLSALSTDGVINWDTGVKSSFDNGVYAGVHKNYSQNLELAADIFNSRLNALVYGLGLEYKCIPEFRFRCGYNSLQKASVGLGLVLNNQLVIDYTYLPDFGTAVDNKHFFSLSWLF
jgi:hypothetical protein